jgi:hypothetical protein
MTKAPQPTAAAPAVPYTGFTHPDAVAKKQSFAILTADFDELREVMDVNLRGATMDVFKYASVKVPSSGGTFWTVHSLEDGDKPVAVIEGIIIYAQDTRAYWVDSNASGTPPDCRSMDGILGEQSDPDSGICPKSGYCRDCPLSKFGSDTKTGRGQACKQKTFLFYVDTETYMPTLLSIPPGSLANLDKYMRELNAKAIPYYSAITKFGLEKKRNADNTEFSTVVFSAATVKDDERNLIVRISPDERAFIAGVLRTQVRDAMKALPAPLADATEIPDTAGAPAPEIEGE